MFKKRFTIELDDIPKTNEDICIAVAKYCGENNLSYEFVKRYRINLWVLRCKEID